jgi:hypothetical protein
MIGLLLTRLALATCAHPDMVPPAPADAADGACVDASLELGARAAATFPDVGVSRALELTRGRAVFGLGGAAASARIGVGAVRSGGEAGYVGVDGESLVAQMQNAEVRLGWARAGLSGAFGLVEEPWIELANRAWGLRPVAPTLAQDQGWVAPFDLGGWVAWTAPGAWVTVDASLLSGEGHQQRERNEGKNLGALVVVRPIPGEAGASRWLELALWARDGSRGLDAARDHRVGGRLGTAGGPVHGAVEVVAGWGLEADAAREPLGVGGWARTDEALPVAAWVRLDRAWAQRGVSDSASTTWRLGGGPRLPIGEARPVFVGAGLEGVSYGPAASPLAGAGAAANGVTALLQVAATPRVVAPVAVSSLGAP